MPPQLGGAPAQVVETSLEFIEVEGQNSSPVRLKADSTYPAEAGLYKYA